MHNPWLIGPTFRPPSEGRSLLLQLTIGCSNNKCTYCDMYRSKTYKVLGHQEIQEQIDFLKAQYQNLPSFKVFLCDGDALGAPMDTLRFTLQYLKKSFPQIRRISTYATAQNILEKSQAQLKELADLGLSLAYIGLESGDDEILKLIVKGNKAQDFVEASNKLYSSNWQTSVMVMLGVGGQSRSQKHTHETAKVLSQMNPDFLGFLSTFSPPGLPYEKCIERGLIKPLTTKELLKEMHDILDFSSFQKRKVIFRANHVSNMFPLGGTLPDEQTFLTETLKEWHQNCPPNQFPPNPRTM